MPIVTDALQLPDRILYELQKAKLICIGEMPEFVPLNSVWGFKSLPSEGFFISSGKIILYETQLLLGRVKVADFLLEEVVDVSIEKTRDTILTISLHNGAVYTIATKLTLEEAQQAKQQIIG